MKRQTIALACLLALTASVPAYSEGTPASSIGDEDRLVADSLAALLRAGRAVISQSQDVINDPSSGQKDLGGEAVLTRALAIYQKTTGSDAMAVDPASRQGRLLRVQMAAIRDVLDANQATINAPGVGFKGFIPAVFARLVSEAFSKSADGTAEMKVTAPPDLVRNRKSRPDAWEAKTIAERFLTADWPAGKSFEEVLVDGGRPLFRIAVPEYYGASCLSCHGAPKGELDVTGYPKEGAAVGDLGGVISIKLSH